MSEEPYNPGAFDAKRAAQANMRRPEIKRFYKQASIAEVEGGYALRLDGRAARTPRKRPIVAPTRPVAEMVAAEWAAQGAVIDPNAMPATRLVHSAIDGVADAPAETRAEIVRFAGSDLVCYRAAEPAELIARQARAHDPVLDWASEVLGARFAVAEGVMFVQQPRKAIEAFEAAVARHDGPLALAALSSLTSLSGSALMALMVARGALAPDEAWRAAHVDEDFQISKWGEDEEAAERRRARGLEFETAARIALGL